MKSGFVVLLLLIVVKQGESNEVATKPLGCYKNVVKHNICEKLTQEADTKLSNKLSQSLANAVQWMRSTSHNDALVSSDVLQAFALSGFLNDGKRCSESTQDEVNKITNATKVVNTLSGGKLAQLLIGLKASCYDDKLITSLITQLKKKMSKFPRGEFNNYFQLSLAMIALYVHNKDVPSIYGEKLLRGLFIGKKRARHLSKHTMVDTEAVALLALSTVVHQKFTAHWVRKHATRELKKAEDKLALMKDTPTNFVTTTLVLQAFTKTTTPVSTSLYCQATIEWLLQQQKEDGSFGGLKQTAWAVIALSGKSILDVKNIKCPAETDTIDEVAYDTFVNDYNDRLKEVASEVTSEETDGKLLYITITISEGVSTPNRPTNVLQRIQQTVTYGTTALQALKQASTINPCFQHKTTMTSWGPSLTKICNIDRNHAKKAYWMFYVNGELASVGASAYRLKNNDSIEFSYKHYSIN